MSNKLLFINLLYLGPMYSVNQKGLHGQTEKPNTLTGLAIYERI